MSSSYNAVILASGEGTRFGARKQFNLLNGVPAYQVVLDKVYPTADHIVVVVNPDVVPEIIDAIHTKYNDPKISVVAGGSSRHESVLNGVNALRNNPEVAYDVLVILESARPLVSIDQISQLVSTIKMGCSSATYYIDTPDAVFNSTECTYENRESLKSIQTPQAFDMSAFINCMDRDTQPSSYMYEECQYMMHMLGEPPTLLLGGSNLTKLTTKSDLSVLDSMNKSKTVFITGGGGAVGSSLVQYFTKNGYQVIAPSRHEMDLTNDLSIMDYISGLKVAPDIIINNAGVMEKVSFSSTDFMKSFDSMVGVNIRAHLRITQFFLTINPSAVVINIGSTSGESGRPEFMGYGITKAGMMVMTESLVAEGYSSFCINPGRLKSKLRSAIYGDESSSNLLSADHVSQVVNNILQGMYSNGDMINIRVDDGVFKIKQYSRI